MTASMIERIRSRRSCAAVRLRCSEISLPTSTGSRPRSGIELLALGRPRAQRGADLLDGGALGVADRAVATLAMGVGNLVGQVQHEAPVLLDLLRRGLLLEQRDRVADSLQA